MAHSVLPKSTLLCFFLVLSVTSDLLLAGAQEATPPSMVALDDTNFRSALDLYKTNESDATALYGDIAEWDVSRVKDMSELELGADFLANLSAWNVSGVTNMAEVSSCLYLYRLVGGIRFIVSERSVRIILSHLSISFYPSFHLDVFPSRVFSRGY